VPSHEKVLQELVMDILRVLSAPDLEVRRKTLNLCLDLVTSRTINEMVIVLKKELQKTQNVTENEDTDKYRQLLIRSLHQLSIKFPDISAVVLPLAIEFLNDNSELAANDVIIFVREIIHKYEHLKELVIQKLLEIYPTIKLIKTVRGVLWILGEYCNNAEDIQSVITLIRQSLGTANFDPPKEP
jgi:coatomer subunit beta